MSEKVTLQAALESLNGFDEIAIEKAFGFEYTDLSEKKPMRMARALVFVLKRRDGLKDNDAYKAAMDLPTKDLQDFFADEEIDPEQPLTEPGKGH